MTDAEKKAAHKERLEQKTVVTSRLSETTRFVAFGIVAWVFAVQASDAKFSKTYIQAHEIWINTAGALAVISIASDYFQYLCAYLSVKHALNRREQGYKFSRNHPAYFFANDVLHHQAGYSRTGCNCDRRNLRAAHFP
ncbi:hypothetical protein J3R80_11105 [Aliiroseovarius sp. Z3]|uniref:hypothetical protein n=1 Tax=Aliiroseovarius sp. Z3 TaxID=2811402 RepID=UPI0023B3279A|nr:hypothetical protein [Aliiroseovarius sp. Z3]MDE9451013.1 hypothetical protein [Aliiroseovarius sp. Z3]